MKKLAYKCPYCGQFNVDSYPGAKGMVCLTCDGEFEKKGREVKEIEVEEVKEEGKETHLELPKVEIPTGWVCPICGAVMSPSQKVCVNCTGQVFSIKAEGDPTTTPDWVKRDGGAQVEPTKEEIKVVEEQVEAEPIIDPESSLDDIAKVIEKKLKSNVFEVKPEPIEKVPDPLPAGQPVDTQTAEIRRGGPGYLNSGISKLII